MKLDETLRYLGLSRHYCGVHQLRLAIQLVQENPLRLCAVMINVYNVVAEQYNCSPACVERNIRTIVLKVWKTNKHRLYEIAGYNMITPPTVAEFIDILATHIQKDNEK